ncbi:hypothetical protein CYMTET_54595 [Cymbomonas tetramitiformis]|uniref:Uncharacterized protein n=1 Tax=Cymbomonas tetramitiformis TaxID=36881 RepID=A0AAE0EP71_9CHLO|nr:hypothetical protein CYMTET_54595 [Cymbomonas tetramitiformis]
MIANQYCVIEQRNMRLRKKILIGGSLSRQVKDANPGNAAKVTAEPPSEGMRALWSSPGLAVPLLFVHGAGAG